VVEEIILPALHAFGPDILFISAGFDGAATDPIGCQLGLRPEDYHWMTGLMQKAADEVSSKMKVLFCDYSEIRVLQFLCVTALLTSPIHLSPSDTPFLFLSPPPDNLPTRMTKNDKFIPNKQTKTAM